MDFTEGAAGLSVQMDLVFLFSFSDVFFSVDKTSSVRAEILLSFNVALWGIRVLISLDLFVCLSLKNAFDCYRIKVTS